MIAENRAIFKELLPSFLDLVAILKWRRQLLTTCPRLSANHSAGHIISPAPPLVECILFSCIECRIHEYKIDYFKIMLMSNIIYNSIKNDKNTEQSLKLV